MAQVLNASNTSGVFIVTQANVGTPEAPSGTDWVPVVGTPKFTPRGPGIIRRADIYTPFGGEAAAKTGGIGWDISITTELYWEFDSAFNVNTYPTLLAPLFRGTPFNVHIGTSANDFVFDSQAIYKLGQTRTGAGNSNNTAVFTILYQETGGKQYSAYDCVCIPKFSWEAGGKVMIEWSIKGKWVDVADSTDIAYTLSSYTDYTPVVGTGCTLTNTAVFGTSTSALAKVTYDPGFALSDVLDSRETYGMGVAMVSLTSSPSLEVEVADLKETLEPDWTEAQDNSIDSSALTVAIVIGNDSIEFTLTNPQLVQWPTPGDSNGYRNIGLKFAGIVTSASQSAIGYINFNSN
jgi:hypothetical protein